MCHSTFYHSILCHWTITRFSFDYPSMSSLREIWLRWGGGAAWPPCARCSTSWCAWSHARARCCAPGPEADNMHLHIITYQSVIFDACNSVVHCKRMPLHICNCPPTCVHMWHTSSWKCCETATTTMSPITVMRPIIITAPSSSSLPNKHTGAIDQAQAVDILY